MTSSQDAVPQRQDSPGAAKTVPVAAAVAAALVCLALLIVVSQGTGYARDVAITTTLSIGLAAGASYATWRIAVNRTQGALPGSVIDGVSLDDRYNLLRAAFDALPEDIFVVDEGDCCVIGNRALAKRLSLQPEALTGAPMERFVPAANYAQYEELNRRARQRASVQTKVHRITRSGEPRVTRSEHFPMGELADITGAVLVVDRDLTGITVAHEKDSRMTTQLVRALVKLLDGRDPFAAHHSAKVAIVAHAIVQEVQSDDRLAQTAKLAGSLLNVGKILAPTDLLVREGDLTEEERERVRDGIKASADLVSHIEFPGPGGGYPAAGFREMGRQRRSARPEGRRNPDHGAGGVACKPLRRHDQSARLSWRDRD